MRYADMAVTVSDLNKYIKDKIADDEYLNQVLVKGEISNFKNHYTGHMYFTLKDENSLIKCICFKSYAQKLTFMPKDGMKVIVLGNVSVFERDGVYQIYVKIMEEDGLGDLYTKYKELKEKLDKQGLFDESHKQKLPLMPKVIGVLSSQTGSVIRDIINVSTRRNPNVYIRLFPVPVQGEGAAEKIAEGIKFMNDNNLADVLILARGGGSLEDLWPFNEEIVARAIFECSVPVISAVGHETDYTIADYVADLRAPTPSAAAELAVFDYEQVRERLDMSAQRMFHQMKQRMEFARGRIREYQLQLKALHPKNQLLQKRQYLTDLEEELERQMQEFLQKKRHQLEMYAAKLDGCSPLKKLQGSYAFLSRMDGRPIQSVMQVQVDDTIQAQLLDGKITAIVCRTEENGVV